MQWPIMRKVGFFADIVSSDPLVTSFTELESSKSMFNGRHHPILLKHQNLKHNFASFISSSRYADTSSDLIFVRGFSQSIP